MTSLDDVCAYGIQPGDEGVHRFAPDYEWWNESVFYDWYDAQGCNAGHCRVGWHPNQQRLWFWLFLFNGDEWLAIEEPRLPLAGLQLPRIAYTDDWGLRFRYTIVEPLRSGRLEAAGFARVISGARVGMILPVSLCLEVEAVGPAHSASRGQVAGHSAEGVSSNRFEQPIRVRGTYSIAGEQRKLTGRGERDHSWGPRMWNMEWTVLVLNGVELAVFATDVRIPGLDPIRLGYLQRERMQHLEDVAFSLSFDHANVASAVAGKFALVVEHGSTLAGAIQPISGHEIDLSHVLVPPKRSYYRRTLVRAHVDDRSSIVGWLESHRFARSESAYEDGGGTAV